MRSDPFAPARRARRNPLKRRDIERVERDLKALVAGPQHGRNRDADFSAFVARQFKRVYGAGLIERDATGRPRRGDLRFGRRRRAYRFMRFSIRSSTTAGSARVEVSPSAP